MKIILIIPGILLAQGPNWEESIVTETYSIFYSKGDTSVEQINEYVSEGLTEVAHFLLREFEKNIDVYVFDTRLKLDAYWQKTWGAPSFESQCWMVGSGIQNHLNLLSPSCWKEEACEHDPNDASEIKRLVSHELTHVLHSNFNRSPAFDDINNIDWFVEGLATYVSGQLDEERLFRTIDYVHQTGGPQELAEFWTGENRYGLAGSMIAYIDKKYGREMLSRLMEYNDVNDILRLLDISEGALIAEWKNSLSGKK